MSNITILNLMFTKKSVARALTLFSTIFLLFVSQMVQIIQITLHEAQFKNKLSPGSRALAKLFFGQQQKSFSNFRTIKNQVCKFHGQRSSLSSHNTSLIKKAYLQIEVIENEKTMNYGRVEINVEKIRETKDGKRVMMELENNKLILKFEVLTSNFEGSEIDAKSQNQQIYSTPIKVNPLQLNLSKLRRQSSNEISPRKSFRGSLTQRVVVTETKKLLESKDNEDEQQKNNSRNQVLVNVKQDDRKSQRAVRKSSLRNNQQKSGRYSRESSLKGSLVKRTSIVGINQTQTSIREGSINSQNQKSISKKVSFASRPIVIYQKKIQDNENKTMYYGSFAIIAFASFVLGVMIKQM